MDITIPIPDDEPDPRLYALHHIMWDVELPEIIAALTAQAILRDHDDLAERLQAELGTGQRPEQLN